jgi:hypothetical protein
MSKSAFEELTPESRFQQIAAILAVGVIRCQRRQRASLPSTECAEPESSPPGLEVPAETRLCVSRRIGG